MSTQALFDPAFIALVREVATDPNSTLLRVPRRPRLVELARPSVVGNHSALLTRAERELVRTHREALAELLFEACKSRIYAGSEIEARRRLTRVVTKNERIEILDAHEWNRRAESVLHHVQPDADETAIELIRRCVSPDDAPSVGVIQLAVAAERLIPADRTRVVAGMGFIFDGQLELAIRLLTQVADGGGQRIDRAYAHMNIAYAYSENSRWQEALDAHRRCEQTGAGLALCPINLLILGVLAALEADARGFARDVDMSFAPDDSLIIQLADAHRSRVAEGALIVSPDARRVATRLAEAVTGSARRIIDALR